MSITPVSVKRRLDASDFAPYTYREIRGLYRNFAGQPDELQILMDFTGLRVGDAKSMLEKLKSERSKAS